MAAQTPAAFPRALTPTVDINYASGLFAQNGAGIAEADLITYSRGSSATFVDRQLSPTNTYEYFVNTEATGNVQRIEYDAATGESLGALIESSSTNLAIRSEEFDNAAWVTLEASVTSDLAAAPDKTLSADKLEAGSTAFIAPLLIQTITTLAATTYTISVFVKRSEASFIQVFFNSGDVANGPRVNFDLSSGAIGSQDADIDAASISPVGNNWFRISCTVFTISTSTTARFYLINSATAGTAAGHSWTAGEGLYIWGAQIERQAAPTSYIPTTSAPVSRLSDSVSMPTVGNVSDGDLTFFADVDTSSINSNGNRYIYKPTTLFAGQIDNRISSTGDILSRNGSNTSAISTITNETLSFSVVDVFNNSLNTLTSYFNGVQADSIEAGTQSAIDNAGDVGIGNVAPASTFQLNGHIKRLTIYSEALTAQEVALL